MTGWQSGFLHAVIQGSRLIKSRPSSVCDFQVCSEGHPNQKKLHGEVAMRSIPGLDPGMAYASCVHIPLARTQFYLMALPKCKGGWEMSSLACAQEEEASMVFGEQLTVSVINSFLRFSEMGTHFLP